MRAAVAAAKKRNIDYKTAQRQNEYYKKKIGWKPETFINQPGIKADSKEFADAIYDMQEATGAYKDGVAGAGTTVRYFQATHLPHDGVYQAAVKVGAEEAQAREAKKAEEAERKEIEALLKDPKIKAAMDTPLPSDEQLKKDLMPLHWENLGNDELAILNIDGRAVIVAKTENGHRLGGHFNFAEHEFEGAKMSMIVKTDHFYALDEITAHETITMTLKSKASGGISFIVLNAQKKDSFFPITKGFFGLHF